MKKTIYLLLALTVCLILSGCCLSHDWEEATCTAPKTCTKCDKTEGEALGHEWVEATCQNPKTCANCAETEGVVLEHEWSEATCQNPKTCINCSETEGAIVDHQWVDVTCLSPGHCKYCNEVGTAPYGHSLKMWEYTDDKRQMTTTCTRCGTVITEELDQEKMAISWVIGEWVASEPNSHLVISSDGTFTLLIDDEEYSGTWRVKGPIAKGTFGYLANFVLEYEGGSFKAKTFEGYFGYVYANPSNRNDPIIYVK